MLRHLTSAFLGLGIVFSAFTASAQSLKPLAASVRQYGESGGAFRTVSLFDAQAPDRAVQQAVLGAQALRLDAGALTSLMRMRPEAIEFVLPTPEGLVAFELIRAEVQTPDFRVVTSESDGKAVDVKEGLHYRGIVQGDENSLAAFSFFDNEVMGLYADAAHGNQVLGRLDVPGNSLNYVLYADSKLRAPNPFSCQMIEPDDVGVGEAPHGVEVLAVNGCVRVYIEADYELYQNKGSVTNTVNYLNGAFNQVATLYTNETISTEVSEVYVWTTPDSYSNSSSSTALNQFRSLRTSFNGNIAHLASLGGNNLGGVAYLDVLCNNSYRYAYSNISSSYQTVPTYSWTVMVMTHEMGHNLGSNHTQWCGWSGGALDNCYTTEGGCSPGPAPVGGGTIMSYCHLTSYGINLANGFGTQPGNKIRSEVSTATCLSATCSTGGGTSCGTPGTLTATSITQSSANLGWGSVVGAQNYNVQLKLSSSSTWTTYTVSGTTMGATGLSAGTAYNFRVQANCSGTLGSYSTTYTFTTQSAPACPDAYEPNNTRSTAKVIPVNTNINAKIASSSDRDWYRFSNNTSARNVKIDLTNLPADYDMALYLNTSQVALSDNGGTTSEQIIYNTVSTTSNFYAYVYGYNNVFNANQCYTIRVSLSSTPWLTGGGDERSGDESFEIPVVFENAAFGMFPNPADATLTLEIPVMESATPVSIALFDVAGKTVQQQQFQLDKSNNRPVLQLQDMANGVYFVQVRNGEQTQTRKLVVQH